MRTLQRVQIIHSLHWLLASACNSEVEMRHVKPRPAQCEQCPSEPPQPHRTLTHIVSRKLVSPASIRSGLELLS
jgi:hypothetical protein